MTTTREMKASMGRAASAAHARLSERVRSYTATELAAFAREHNARVSTGVGTVAPRRANSSDPPSAWGRKPT